MKKTLLFCIITSFLVSCSGVKKTQEAINTGNYSIAIDKALSNLTNNKTKKGNQPYILLLEDAFKKNTERERKQVTLWEKDDNPAYYEVIYNSYTNLRAIQKRIRPILPLYIQEENREAKFVFNDYENNFLDAKDQLSEHLYDTAEDLLLNAQNKQEFRKAYSDFTYLEKINPGFEDTRQKIEEAHAKGIDYVRVLIVNQTEQIIPVRLEEELLNFDTYGLNDLWTTYHNTVQQNLEYDYEMQLSFREINISPEQLNEKHISKEKQIKDGYKYAVDTKGKVVKDSLGNKIKIDKFKTVRSDFYHFTQYKAAQVVGNVSFIDLQNRKQLNSYPLASEFIFEHSYADYEGDKRALDYEQQSLLKIGPAVFPTNEQMVYDAGEDIKIRLKNIVKNNSF